MPIIALYAIVAAVIFTLGGSVGWKITSDHYEAKHAKEDRVALEDFQAAVTGMNNPSAALQETQNENRIVYRTIKQKVPTFIDRPVYRNECLDDDGLQLINESLDGKLHSGEPVEPVPASQPVAGQDRQGRG